MKSIEEKGQSAFWDGEVAVAMSMGDFISLLVDGGINDQLVVRILEREDYPGTDVFRLRFELDVVPTEKYIEHLFEHEIRHIYGRIKKMMADFPKVESYLIRAEQEEDE